MLTNGLIQAQEYIMLEKPVSNKIVTKLMFRNGSIADPPGKEGLTYLTATLMVEGGTEQYSKTAIDEMVYPMAAQYYAKVDKEVSTFTFEVPVIFMDDFYKIMTGMIISPAFSQEDFDRIKSNQLNYVDQVIRASSDEDFSKMALENFLFENTSYQHMVMGTVTGIKSINLQDVKEHYQKYFTSKNLWLGLAGNYEEELIQMLKKDIQKLPDHNPDLPAMASPQSPNGIQVKIISKENALGSAIYTGYPLQLTRANDEFAALMIANSYLGEHRKSYGQLYQKIRETRSMNYGDYTYIEWYDQGGRYQLPPAGVPRSSNYFSIWIRPVQIASSLKQQYQELEQIKVGHAHFALRLAIREIENLIENGMSEVDFQLTKQFLQSYIKLYIQTPERELGFLMDSRFYDRMDYITELGELLENVTLEQVNEAIKKYLQVDNMYVAIVTDDSEAGPLAESLKQNQPSPMSYSDIVKEGLPEEVQQEDQQIATYPLNITSVEIIDSNEMFME